MKTLLLSIVSGALMLGVAASQDGATPPPSAPTTEPQTSTPAQGSAQQTTVPAPVQQAHQKESPRAAFFLFL